jgi:hypothetical protein
MNMKSKLQKKKKKKRWKSCPVILYFIEKKEWLILENHLKNL